ncbi:MAG: hypothetical protein RIQ60_1890 [Pseudomonadota bacterium]|jgi:hypothetical protein
MTQAFRRWTATILALGISGTALAEGFVAAPATTAAAAATPAAAVAVAAAASSPAPAPLSAKDIKDGWVGKTLAGRTATSAAFTLAFAADGSAVLTVGSSKFDGAWRLSDSGYCTTWKNIRGAQERCYTASRSGEQIALNHADGSPGGVITSIR